MALRLGVQTYAWHANPHPSSLIPHLSPSERLSFPPPSEGLGEVLQRQHIRMIVNPYQFLFVMVGKMSRMP